jgi:hypothetical protein
MDIATPPFLADLGRGILMVHSGWIRKDRSQDSGFNTWLHFQRAYYNPTLGRLRREGSTSAAFFLLTGRKAASSLVQAVPFPERMEQIII